ncbi:hypothetical protein ABR36_16570, partial [Enterobacter ludwigii]
GVEVGYYVQLSSAPSRNVLWLSTHYRPCFHHNGKSTAVPGKCAWTHRDVVTCSMLLPVVQIAKSPRASVGFLHIGDRTAIQAEQYIQIIKNPAEARFKF